MTVTVILAATIMGMILGGCIGLVVAAMCIVGSREDEQARLYRAMDEDEWRDMETERIPFTPRAVRVMGGMLS